MKSSKHIAKGIEFEPCVYCVAQILQHLGQIDASEPSEVKTYIQRLLEKEGHTVALDVNGTNDENRTPRVHKLALINILHLGYTN